MKCGDRATRDNKKGTRNRAQKRKKGKAQLSPGGRTTHSKTDEGGAGGAAVGRTASMVRRAVRPRKVVPGTAT